jgi:uncharacterized protein (TIGR03382 family)
MARPIGGLGLTSRLVPKMFVLGLPVLLLCGVTLGDDFESSALLKPAGQWESQVLAPGGGLSIFSSDAGAHRGAYGLRVADNDSTTGDGIQGYLVGNVSTFGSGVYLRAWIRRQLTAANHTWLLKAELSTTNTGSAEVAFDSNGRLSITGFADNGDYLTDIADAGVPRGEWHLFEMWATGIGTTQGARSLWLDGRQVVNVNLSYQSEAPVEVWVGEYWSEPRTPTGTVDYDDVRVSSAPNATWVGAYGAATAQAGDCVPFQVRLTDVMGAAAQAPYNVLASVSGASLFSNASCTVATSTVTISPGTTQVTTWLKATADAQVTASHPDFLSAPAWAVTVTGMPDAGPPDAGMMMMDGGPPDSGPAIVPDGGSSPTLAFVLGEPQLPAGVVSSLMRVQARDSNGAPLPQPEGLAIELHTSSSRGGFALKPTDNTSQTFTVNVAAGGAETGFYYRDYSEGTATLTTSAPGFAPATALIEVTQGMSSSGCGCAHGPELLLALALLALKRRR